MLYKFNFKLADLIALANVSFAICFSLFFLFLYAVKKPPIPKIVTILAIRLTHSKNDNSILVPPITNYSIKNS